jgi:hypothetical protein
MNLDELWVLHGITRSASAAGVAGHENPRVFGEVRIWLPGNLGTLTGKLAALVASGDL